MSELFDHPALHWGGVLKVFATSICDRSGGQGDN